MRQVANVMIMIIGHAPVALVLTWGVLATVREFMVWGKRRG